MIASVNGTTQQALRQVALRQRFDLLSSLIGDGIAVSCTRCIQGCRNRKARRAASGSRFDENASSKWLVSSRVLRPNVLLLQFPGWSFHRCRCFAQGKESLFILPSCFSHKQHLRSQVMTETSLRLEESHAFGTLLAANDVAMLDKRYAQLVATLRNFTPDAAAKTTIS